MSVKIFYHDHFVLPLPEGHRFPLAKYTLLRQRVVAAGLVPPGSLVIGPSASDQELLRVHHPEYIRRVSEGLLTNKEIRRIGFPWSPGLVERSRRSVGSTISACRTAVSGGLGINLAGGTHHAGADYGQGFCVFNDCAVAARTMQDEGLAKRILVIDCDVHQGNGTADIFAGDPTVYTFSIHGDKNFPFHKVAGDLDIGLEDDTDDATYLAALDRGLVQSFDQAQADLAIYLAGADPFMGDRLGRLALTKQGLAERDHRVFESCRQARLPLAVVMAGGYGRRLEDTVDIHFNTVRLAISYYIGDSSPA